jgi:hypothetical protein
LIFDNRLCAVAFGLPMSQLNKHGDNTGQAV